MIPCLSNKNTLDAWISEGWFLKRPSVGDMALLHTVRDSLKIGGFVMPHDHMCSIADDKAVQVLPG
jgi:hypothetical protein